MVDSKPGIGADTNSAPRADDSPFSKGASATVRRGLFITFEGPEGGGKSTQLGRLAERLLARGITVSTTREPGGTPAGERIRDVLLDPAGESLRAETEAFLVLAARSELVARFIRPHLELGTAVLCDRYADATRAYQGYGGGLSIELLDGLIEMATGGLQPDLTLLFDLPVEMGLARRRQDRGEWTRLDAATTEFHQRVRDGYLEMAQKESSRWAVIDAAADPSTVEAEVWETVSRLLTKHAGSATNEEERR